MEVPEKLRSALVGIRYWLLALVFLATSTLLVSCNNSSTVTVVKGPDTITITVSSDTAHPEEDVTITVTLVDDAGDPIDATTVDFAITTNNSSAGLSALNAVTDINGQASIVYTAGITSKVTDRVTASVTLTGADVELTKSAFVDITVEPTLVGSITLETGTFSMVANGTSETAVRAIVLDVNGAPVVGEPVSFISTLGSIIGSPANTNIDGIAQVTLRAGTVPGTALITGTVAGFSSNAQVQLTSGAPDDIDITATPTTIAPLDTSAILVTVEDEDGSPVANETIIFSIDDNDSGGSFSALTAVTNINGQAVVQYTAGSVEGTDTIRARTQSNGIFDTQVITVKTTTGAVVVGSLTVIAGTDTLRANNADFTVLRATVLDTGGQPVPNIDVSFSTTLGSITGSPAKTNSNGIAQVTLKAGTIAGTSTSYAMTGGFSAQVDVEFLPGAPFNVNISASPTTVGPLGTSTVLVEVYDDRGNPVPDETIIFNVETNNTGGSFPVLTGVTDLNGMVIVNYNAGGVAGTDTIRARTASNGKDDTVNVTVDLTAGLIGSITVTAGDSQLIADGTSEITIRAQVFDVDNRPAVGVEVFFSSTLGTFPDGASDFTDDDGRAQVTLRSGTDVGIATVMASSGGFNDTIDIPFVADESNTLTITATPTTINPLGTTAVAVELVDSFGSPVVGETIIFSILTDISGGEFSSLTAVTDINGMAVVEYTAGGSGTPPFNDVIRARSQADASVDDTQNIGISATGVANVGSLTLAAEESTIFVAGTASPNRTLLTVELKDTNGDPVPATAVIMTTTLGTFNPGSPWTTGPDGIALLELVSEDDVGKAMVNVYYGGFNDQVEVEITAGPPANITLTPVPSTIAPLGTTSVMVELLDAGTNTNPVVGETIIFSIPGNTSGGSFDTLTAVTDINGMAVVQYTAGTNGTPPFDDTINGRVQSDASVNDDAGVSISATAIPAGTLTLEVNDTTLIADGAGDGPGYPDKTQLTATLKDINGDPIPNTNIVMTTTLGIFDPVSPGPYTTDNFGVATLELEAEATLGTATVNAYYGGLNANVEVDFVAGPPADITIDQPAAPASVAPLGSLPVVVTVTDDAGHPVSGETVLFTIQIDSSSSPSFSPTSAVTNALGQATVQYTAGGTAGGDDRLRATVGSNAGIWDQRNINVTGTADVGSITVSAPVTTLVADGTSTTTVTAVVRDPDGVLAPNVSVTISTTAGSINSAPPAYNLSDSGTTDANGEWTATFYSSTNLGTATITATAGGLFANTTITFIAGPAAAIVLSADPVNITADGTSTSTVRATVTDAQGHLITYGETITFSLENGSGGSLSPLMAQTVNGVAEVTYTAGDDETVNGGGVDVRAEATNPAVFDEDVPLITLIAEVVYSIELTIDNATLTADGSDYATLQATVRNTDLNLVADGTMVTFTTSTNPTGDAGDLGPAIPVTPGTYTLAAPTVNGIATMYLRSSTVAGSYMMQATAGSIDQYVGYTFEAGPADSTNIGTTLAANPASILSDGTSTALVTLTALDANDNPVKDGTAVQFFTDAGTLIGPNPTTTVGGIATITIQSSIVPTATVNLDALIDGQMVSTTMAFVSSASLEPNFIVLELLEPDGVTPSDGSLTVESPAGNDAILIKATVYDGTGNPIPDCTDNIDFTIFQVSFAGDAKLDGQSNVYFPPPPAPGYIRKTTVNGVAMVSLTPGTESGTIRVGARARTERDCTVLAPASQLQAKTTPIVIASGQAEKITIYANPNVTRNSDGTTSQIINALVTDIYGNPVSDGTAVGWGLTDNSFTFPPDFGVICDTTFTGDAAPGLDCNPGAGLAAKGVARTLLTWLPEGIGVDFALGAETNTDAGLVADALFGTYPAVEDIIIDVTTVPSSILTSVFSGMEVWAEMFDNSGVPLLSNPINGQTITFTSNNPGVVTFTGGTTDTTGAGGNPDGFATVDVDLLNCSTSSTTVTFTGSAGPYSGSTGAITVPANDQVASFTWVGGGAQFEVDFTNTSTPQTNGGATTYSWDFGDGTCPGPADCSQQNPTHTYTDANPYNATLTITSAAGCSTVSATQAVNPTP